MGKLLVQYNRRVRCTSVNREVKILIPTAEMALEQRPIEGGASSGLFPLSKTQSLESPVTNGHGDIGNQLYFLMAWHLKETPGNA